MGVGCFAFHPALKLQPSFDSLLFQHYGEFVLLHICRLTATWRQRNHHGLYRLCDKAHTTSRKGPKYKASKNQNYDQDDRNTVCATHTETLTLSSTIQRTANSLTTQHTFFGEEICTD